jgi:hypothetical protein
MFGSLPTLALPKTWLPIVFWSTFGLMPKFWLPMGVPPFMSQIICQIIGQVWVEDSLAKKLASQFLPTFGRAM